MYSLYQLKNFIKSSEKDKLDLTQLIQTNIFINSTEDPIADLRSTSCYKKIEAQKEKMEKGEFSWKKEQDQDSTVFENLKDLTHFIISTKNRRDQISGAESRVTNFINSTFLNSSYIQKSFSLEVIKRYLSHPNYLFGTVEYDEALRIQTNLLEIFLNFHLKNDFRFESKIDAENLKIIDCLTRIRIRKKNLKNEFLKKKYFNENFNLKKFLYKLYDDFFPNVTWRYIGSGHQVPRMIFQITEFMFQLGLWTYEDHEKLVKILLEKSENLKTLENACIRDIKSNNGITESFLNEMCEMFTDIKEYLSLIIIHIVTLVNDESWKESLTWTKERKKLFRAKEGEKLVNVFYKDRELNNILINILMKLLGDTTKFNSNLKTEDLKAALEQKFKRNFINSRTKQNFETIFMMLSTVEYDVFHISNELVTDKQIFYYISKSPKIEKLKSEMEDIRENLINLIADIASGGPDPAETLKKNGEDVLTEKYFSFAKKSIKYMMNWIFNFMNTKIKIKHENFIKQMTCGDNGIVQLLLNLSTLIEGYSTFNVELIMILRVLTLICKDNFVTQSQLFIGDSKIQFEKINQKHSLLSTIINRNIFMNNNRILYVNPNIFYIFFEDYTAKVKKLVNFLTTGLPENWENFDISKIENCPLKKVNEYSKSGIISDIVSIYSLNSFIEKVVEFYKIKTSQRNSYDMLLQEFLVDKIVDFALKVLSDKNFLPKKGEMTEEDIKRMETREKNKLENSEKDDLIKSEIEGKFILLDIDLNDLIKIPKKEKFTKFELKMLVFELCVSFLRLFNRVTKRYILGSTYKQIEKNVFNYLPSYLLSFKEGIYVYVEFVRFMKTFKIFPNNSLITQRIEIMGKRKGVTGLENPIPSNPDHSSQYFVMDICDAIDTIKTVVKWAEYDEKWIRNQSQMFIYKGIFPLVYKFVNGIYVNFFIHSKLKNDYQLHNFLRQIRDIFDALFKNSAHLSTILKKKFEKPMNLLFLKKLKISHLGSTMEMGKKNYKDMEKDEYFYPGLYELRKKCLKIMDSIKEAYDPKYLYAIEKYSRFTALRRDSNKKNSSHLENLKKRRGYEKFQNFRSRSKEISKMYKTRYSFVDNGNFSKEEKKVIFRAKNEFKEFSTLAKFYHSQKKEWLEKKDEDNILLNYFEKNPSHMREICIFLFDSIFEGFDPRNYPDHKQPKNKINTPDETDYFVEETDRILKKKKKKFEKYNDPDFVISRFFEGNFIYPYLIFINKIISSHESFKLVLYCLLCYKKEDKINLYSGKNKALQKKILDIWDGFNPSDIKFRNRYREVISNINYLFMVFSRFCRFKTFMNEDWNEIWDKFDTLGDLFKNLCEDNSIYFKTFLGTFKPKMRTNSNFNSVNWNLFFSFYVYFESFMDDSTTWYTLKENRLVMSDRPETIVNYIKSFDILTEFVNGPCPINQRMIHVYRPDMYYGLITRVIDDVDSHFYFLKERVINYVLGLVESEGYGNDDIKTDFFRVTKFWASNFSPRQVYGLIHQLIKKLAMSNMMKKNEKFRKKILDKVKKERMAKIEKIKSELKEGEELESNSRYIKIQREMNYEELHNVFENKNSIVSKEMMKQYKFKSFSILLRMYKQDAYFYNHNIITICLKLFSLLQKFGQNHISKSIKLFMDSKTVQLAKYFYDDMDLEDRVSDTVTLTRMDSTLSEDLIFFLFILKISRKIEISVKLPTIRNRINKIIYFPLVPSTLYLEKETRDQFFRTLEVEHTKSEIQKNMIIWFKEMDLNHKFSQTNRLMFLLSKNDTLWYQRLFCWIFGFGINILGLFAFKLNTMENLGDRRLESPDYKQYIDILSIIFSIYNFIQILIFSFYRFPKVFSLGIETYRLEHPFENMESSKLTKLKIGFNLFTSASSPSSSFLSHIVFALLGVFYQPFFHTLHLLLLVNISKTSMYVVKASFAHKNQLFSTILLAVFIMYSYSVLTANFYSDMFDIEENDVCGSLLSCFLYTLNLGLRNGGGISDSMKLYRFNQGKFGLKMLFDLSFFMIINVISLNIVFGIIIDTFGELRSAENERTTGLKSKCIICQNPRTLFEQSNTNFKQHISADHDIWHYVYYIKYLLSKDREDYNGDEISVFSDFSNKSTVWMPKLQTLYLSHMNEDEESNGLEEIGEKVEDMGKEVKKLGKDIEELKKVNEKILNILEKNK